ncbi:MAG: hypothetical protein ACXADL_05365 [Candidatus Thorarchaeota archaeon]|jgi:hypothetical protein
MMLQSATLAISIMVVAGIAILAVILALTLIRIKRLDSEIFKFRGEIEGGTLEVDKS